MFIDKIDDLSTTVNLIVLIARNVEGFDEINRDDIKKIIMNYDQDLTLKELKEITVT